ncbi:MAG TPA: carboxypeptidase-like regulatory domain-containing protein [Chthoniobacterales bacterium]|nr:carboxypeptidase-like regulatory domain-containing protein [Chthoniobacterales bacterium]
MKHISRGLFFLVALFAATAIYGAVPAINVTVSDAGGKAAFKGTTNANGVFGTSKLTPGNYTVQFASQSADMKGKHFAIVVGAGSKKVSAGAVPGEKFARGGVALKVDVGSGLNITGQVSAEARVNKSGKKMVWIPPMVGSNMPGRWVEEDSAEAATSKARGNMSKDAVNKMQESANNPQG